MKFLICGLGSIGQRHYKNLKSLGYDDIFVFRSGRGDSDFVKKFLLEFKPREIFNLKEALTLKPDVVFVTNPTAYHIPTALEAARANCHIFIEKPISHTSENLEYLLNEVTKRNLISYVAYHLRFHPLLLTIKTWLSNNKRFGRAISVHAALGERVTNWHPWEDYRTSYSCRGDLGGGVVLTQSHEVDYLHWLFGPVSQVSAMGGQLSDLEIDVEDVAKAIFKFKSGVIGSLDLDYLKSPPKRTLEIVTTSGKIAWDYFGKTAEFASIKNPEDNLKISEPDNFERNTLYLLELENFIKCVQENRQPLNSLAEAYEVFKLILGVKKSMLLDGQSVRILSRRPTTGKQWS
ncbi:MAG: Gfo/Idh/MocA family oxidoreductase, partial [Parcubacteria group bacterium]|nr:Gfo/Idh/MocA family oxidoreductase [Parcubacteria group bacterium]